MENRFDYHNQQVLTKGPQCRAEPMIECDSTDRARKKTLALTLLDICSLDDVMDCVLSFLLEDEQSLRFGSWQKRINFTLIGRRFAQFVRERRLQKTAFYANGFLPIDELPVKSQEWLLDNVKGPLPPAVLAAINPGVTLVLKRCQLSVHDLRAIAEARSRLSSLVMEECDMELETASFFSRYLAHERLRAFQVRAIAFIAQVILPFQGLDLTVSFPRIRWTKRSVGLGIGPETSFGGISEKKTCLRVHLRAGDEFGCFLHWYCHLAEQGLFQPWASLNVIFVHPSLQSLCTHHGLLFGPTYLDKRYFEVLDLATPKVDMPDIHHVIWRLVESQSACDRLVLVDRIEKSANYVMQTWDRGKGYSAQASNTEISNRLSAILVASAQYES
jgi:hypothetical protein